MRRVTLFVRQEPRQGDISHEAMRRQRDLTFNTPRTVCMRCVVNALFYIDKTGCQWQMLPGDLPNYGTVYDRFRRWTEDGTLERMHTDLRRMLRVR